MNNNEGLAFQKFKTLKISLKINVNVLLSEIVALTYSLRYPYNVGLIGVYPYVTASRGNSQEAATISYKIFETNSSFHVK